MNIDMIELILKVLLFVFVGMGFLFLMKYIYDFKVFHLISAKVKGDILEYDRVRREQMKEEFQRSKSILEDNSKSKTKISFVSKLYKRIKMTGISTKFPGFSETTFVCAVLLLGILIYAVVSVISSALVAIVTTGIYLLGVWYILDLIAYNRRMNVEGQLLQFTNACASASRQYSNIVDIIGSVYDQFTGPFRDALQECYVDAKTNNNKELAFAHLKERFDSVQLAFVIDNFDMCSSSTGDYYTIATDLSKTISIYSSSHERRAVTLRNAKVNILAMFVIALVIVYSLGTFFDSGLSTILHTPIGNILLVALVGVFIFGISIKAD